MSDVHPNASSWPQTFLAGTSAHKTADPVDLFQVAAPPRRAYAIWLALCVITGVYYFAWLLQPERVGVPLLFGALLLADGFNLIRAGSFWVTVARGRASDPPAADVPGSVDVLIPTLNEPISIVEPTLRGALALTASRPDVRVFLLDDGNRPEMKALAERLGAFYIAREKHVGAKAGNINHALSRTTGAFVAIFDCDHIPRKDFLAATLPYFRDESVALVQTPQVYRNAKHNAVAAAASEQQTIFFGPLCTGRDGWGSTFCCGTNVVLRRAALEEVGGFDETSITEDLATSVQLHARGWTTRYVDKVLSDGLGPEDIASYVSQQYRWARGCLAVLFSRALWQAPISRTLKWQYVAGCMHFLSGWTVLFYALLPIFFLVGGWLPINLEAADQFVVHFLPYYLVSMFYVSFASSGLAGVRGLLFTLGSFPIHIRATIAILTRRKMTFSVTPKERVEGLHLNVFWPNLLLLMLLVAACLYAPTQGLTPEISNGIAFAIVNMVVVGGILAVSHLAPPDQPD